MSVRPSTCAYTTCLYANQKLRHLFLESVTYLLTVKSYIGWLGRYDLDVAGCESGSHCPGCKHTTGFAESFAVNFTWDKRLTPENARYGITVWQRWSTRKNAGYDKIWSCGVLWKPITRECCQIVYP